MPNNVDREISATAQQCRKMLGELDVILQENCCLHNYGARIDELKRKVEVVCDMQSSEDVLVRINAIFWEIFETARPIVKLYLEAGNYSQLATPSIYQFIASRLFKLKKTDAWRGKMKKTDGFKKEEKEALQAMFFTLFCIHDEVHEGRPFNKGASIGYIILRVLKKSYTWDAKPRNKEALRSKVHNYDFFEMLYVIKESISETNLIFVSAIYDLAKQFSKADEALYKTAKAAVNAVEFKQIEHTIFAEERETTRAQIEKEWNDSDADKYVPNKLEALLERISWGRNTVRWQGYAYVVDCNILAHMFETAFFSYLMALEENNVPKAERGFFVSLFHDLAEVWTDDIPSPCKDSIHDENGINIREITGMLEQEALEERFYSRFSPEEVAYMRAYLIFEDVQDEEFYKFIKRADYFSADYELWWNFCEGSKEARFRDIINNSCKLNRTPSTQKVVEYMRDQIASLVLLEP